MTLRNYLPTVGIFGLLITGSIAGCGGGDSNGGTAAPPSIVGRYQVASISGQGITTPCPGERDLGNGQSISCGTITADFRADNTVTLTTREDGTLSDARGTYRLSGNNLSGTFTQIGSDTNGNNVIEASEVRPVGTNDEMFPDATVAIEASRLTLTSTIGGVPTVIVFTRQ